MKIRIVAQNNQGTFRGKAYLADNIYQVSCELRETINKSNVVSLECDSNKFVIFAYEILKTLYFLLKKYRIQTMPRMVIMNKFWYFQFDCGDTDKQDVLNALENFVETINTQTLQLDNGHIIVMPVDILEQTTFVVDDGEINEVHSCGLQQETC